MQENEELLACAERAASDAKDLLPLLSGHAPWGAKADAALATVALARRQPDRAIEAARTAVSALTAAQREDLNLDILLPVAAAISAAGTDDERTGLLSFLRVQATVIANRIVDEGIRTRWFRGPIGRTLAELASDPDVPLTRNTQDGTVEGLGDDDEQLLRLVVEGLSNEELAARLGTTAGEVAGRLTSTYAKIGASSRADATAFAFQSRML